MAYIKKDYLFLMLIVLFLVMPAVSAINVEVEKITKQGVYIPELDNKIIFDLNMTNHGLSDNFKIYNLLGFTITPEEISIGKDKSKLVSLEVESLGQLPDKGFYTLPYYLKGSYGNETENKLTIKAVGLGDIFLIGSESIDPELNSVEIFITNRENFDFSGENKIKARFSSPFFDTEKTFSLSPSETKKFTVSLNKQDFKNLTAGFYTMTADVEVNGAQATSDGTVGFIEKNIVTTTSTDFGFLVSTKIIEKVNEGNTIETSETTVRKNILSRLFTSLSPEPDIVEREFGSVYYTWISEVRPGETYKISVRTNWIFPLLIIFFIVAIVALSKQYTKTHLVLKKKVSFVKAKGGEFALKVSILVSAKSYVERVNVIDRLPPLVEIHERFGGEEPSRIDKRNRRIEWNFEKLESGETRVLSYIIYSKVGVLGKFALPTANAIYEKGGKIQEAESNRAFFITEQRGKKEIEED
jgi:hypothetical protein